MIKRILTALTAVTVLMGVTPAAEAQPSTLQAPLRTQAVFNDPTTAEGEVRIFRHLTELINGAARNSRIRVAMFQWLPDDGSTSEPVVAPVVDALIRAYRERNVKVQVLVDQSTINEEPYEKLAAALNEVRGDESWAHHCAGTNPSGARQACIGYSDERDSTMHNKFFLFTSTLGARWVVSNGSGNMGPFMAKMWNSQYTVVNNRNLYTRFKGYFEDLNAQRNERRRDPNYYAQRPPLPSILTNTTSYHYPRAEGDPFVNNLRDVRCPGTSIRIAAWSLSRTALATALRKLAEDGCTVSIIVNWMGKNACEILIPADGSPKVEIRGASLGDRPGVHQKDVLIAGRYLGDDNTAVFTGSANLNRKSLRHNDENVIRVLNNRPLYDQFLDNFEHLRRNSPEVIDRHGPEGCNRIAPPEPDLD
ncbi:phosphatidylserine/phosphatidylglycerophosphate/cardiolipin synthase family protein [Actinomadura sp. 6N118]|uniref:phosphatidylserine/phosphatidylglycerophosphate/ cardiolipin synthase family protein n=1 Tax=Actinomadura sp. 6N118 TaxID=3375151 RepID=UPI0037B05791